MDEDRIIDEVLERHRDALELMSGYPNRNVRIIVSPQDRDYVVSFLSRVGGGVVEEVSPNAFDVTEAQACHLVKRGVDIDHRS